MPFTMFTLAMLFISILCIGREVFCGFVRGPVRALVSLCAVILSIICSVFISCATGGLVSKALMEGLINDLIAENIEVVSGFLSFYKTASFLIQSIANVLIFVVAFPICKWIINGLIAIAIKSKKSFAMTSQRGLDKLYGSLIGVLCGIITAVTVISPIMGTVHLLGDVVSVANNISQSIPAEQNVAFPELDPIDTYTNDAVGNLSYAMGGELIYRHLTFADFNGEQINLLDEIASIEKASHATIGIVESFSDEEGATAFQESANNVYLCFEESKILKAIAIEVISDFSSTWMRGEDFIGIQMPDFNNDFRPLVNEILLICSEINEYNIMPTAKTLLDIVGVILECDIRTDSTPEDIDYYLLASKLWLTFESNPGMENVKWRLENVANIAIAEFVSQNLTNTQRARLTTEIARDTAQVLIDIEGTDARVEAVGEKISEKFEEIDPSLCKLFAHKLVSIAEEKYDQISSSDVEALLNQSKGGLLN